MPGVQSSTVREPSGSKPNSIPNATRPMSATTLFSTGTQVNGPKLRRALSTSPSSV
jgi:hypothetical protein